MRSAARLLCALLLLAAPAWGADPAIVRGVYADWSVVLQTAGSDAGITAATTRRIASMARSNVNLIWWTNLPDDPVRLAQIVRESRARGIECVFGSGHWYIGSWNYARSGEPITLPYQHLRASGARLAWRAGAVDQQFPTIQRLRAALPADDQPMAWSLADEPPPAALESLRQLADRCRAAGIPTIAVQVPEYHAETIDRLGASIPTLACDVYPSFRAGLGPVDPIAWAKSEHAAVIRRSRSTGVAPLLMVQGFGDPSLFAMPSPARTRWQIWSAVAAGSRGAVVFAHGVPWVMPDGSAASLVDPRTETPTAAGTTVAATFARLKAIEVRLAGAAIDPAPSWGSVGLRGDCVAIFRPTTGPRMLLVVADPDATGPRTLKVTLPGVSRVAPLAESTGATLQALPWPWSMFFPATLQVSLQPGDAWVGELR